MRPFLLALAIAMGAAACGQKGPLYLRESPPPGLKPQVEIYQPIPYPERDGAEK